MPSIILSGVVHQTQLNAQACWYTSLQMAVRYYENKAQGSVAGLSGPENFPVMQARFTSGGNVPWVSWRSWAGQCGFAPLDITPTIQGIYDTVAKRGPILYSGTWAGSFNGHIVLITGVDTDNGNLYVEDPLDASGPATKNFNSYLGQLSQTTTDNPLFVH